MASTKKAPRVPQDPTKPTPAHEATLADLSGSLDELMARRDVLVVVVGGSDRIKRLRETLQMKSALLHDSTLYWASGIVPQLRDCIKDDWSISHARQATEQFAILRSRSSVLDAIKALKGAVDSVAREYIDAKEKTDAINALSDDVFEDVLMELVRARDAQEAANKARRDTEDFLLYHGISRRGRC